MLKNYIKIALKVLLRRKFFTFISLFAISFTLVVLMVATATLDYIFAPMPPETKQDRTLGVFYMQMTGPNSDWDASPGYALLNKYMRNISNVEQFSIYGENQMASSFKDGMEIKSMLKHTDGEYWKILDFSFIEGRPITDDDEKNANFVAVINRATREKFFGNESAVGKFIEVNRQRFEVVGVVENVSYLRQIPCSDIWVPNSTSPQKGERDQIMGGYFGLFLAHDKNDFPLIKKEFQSRLPGIQLPDKDYNKVDGTPETYFENTARDFFGEGQAPLLLASILIIMLLFMLLPTINLVNINISRIMERSSEIGIRKSFGASSWTLVGQFVVENIIITAIGGVFGFLFAALILSAINNSNLIPYAHLQLNLRVFGYGFIMILFFGILSGVYPAWKMSRLHPVLALKGISR